jgi:phage anti-repressor protein
MKKIIDCKKCKKRGITIHRIGGKNMVNSFELYKTAGMRGNNYTRWMKKTVFALGCSKKDYLPAPNNKRSGRKKLRYYFKINFAISLCLAMRRKKSIEIRNFLLQVR